MELKVTQYEVEESGVAVVRLHRPGRGNSWTRRMNEEYRWIMRELDESPDVRVIILTGSSRQFCVGADFKALDTYVDGSSDYVTSVDTAELAKPGHGVHPEFDHDLVWQWGIRKPLIAAVNGACAGIGVALAAFSDLRFAAAGAKFTSAAPKIGLPAEYGLAWILPRIVGTTHAADILLTGRVFLAEEAARMGFLNAVLPMDELMPHVLALARGMAATVSPASIVAAKLQLYAELMSPRVGQAVEESKTLIGAMMRAADFREGVAAMREARPPRFPGLGGARFAFSGDGAALRLEPAGTGAQAGSGQPSPAVP